jgi:hypothetical protein
MHIRWLINPSLINDVPSLNQTTESTSKEKGSEEQVISFHNPHLAAEEKALTRIWSLPS